MQRYGPIESDRLADLKLLSTQPAPAVQRKRGLEHRRPKRGVDRCSGKFLPGLSPVSDEEQVRRQPNDRYNLENAYIYIDGKRYNVKELLKLVVEQVKATEL